MVVTQRIADLFLVVVSFILAYLLKKYVFPGSLKGLSPTPSYYVILLLTVMIWYLILSWMGDHGQNRLQPFPVILWKRLKMTGVAMVALVSALFILKITEVSRVMIGSFFVINAILQSVGKWVVIRFSASYRKKGFGQEAVLVVGSRERAKTMIDTIFDDEEVRYKVIGCLDPDPLAEGLEISRGVKVIGNLERLPTILRGQVVDGIVIAMPLRMLEEAGRWMSVAEQFGVWVRIVPDWQIHSIMYRPKVASIHIDSFLGVPVLTLITTTQKQGSMLAKTVIDYVFTGLVLFLLLPVFAAIAFTIKVTDRGPVFFRQERVSLRGRPFMLYKFRTMVVDAEKKTDELKRLNEADGPVFKIKRDPRIIPYIGHFLRRTSLDELPQFLNVLKGEMSIVGPRPPIPSEVNEYEDSWRRRLSMKPGLTCLWQVAQNRHDLKFGEWMSLDLQYIDSWSLWMDIKIMFQTFIVVLSGRGR